MFIPLACVLVACGGERASTPDASDGISDGAPDAVRDATNEGAPDSGPDRTVCTSSMPSDCIGVSGCQGCPPTWNEALADRSFCVPSCGYQNEFLSDCGQYETLMRAADDCSRTYYYEKSSGALVGLFSSCTSQTVCDFGPPGFTQPTTCSPSVQLYPCVDGSTDGATE